MRVLHMETHPEDRDTHLQVNGSPLFLVQRLAHWSALLIFLLLLFSNGSSLMSVVLADFLNS